MKRVIPIISDRYVIGIKFGEIIRKLFLIIPAVDGSLYVSFPYSPFDCGRVGVLTVNANAASVMIGDEFSVTTQHVKYSHHPNGTVALSQTKRVRTIQKSGVPFGDISGHIFSATFQGIERYEGISTAGATKRGRVVAAFSSPQPRAAYKFQVHVHSEQELEARIVGNGSARKLTCVTPSGKIVPGIVLATKFQSQLGTKYLVVFVEAVERVCTQTDEFLIFLGGFDAPEVSLNVSMDTRALMFFYPEKDYTEELLRRVGTIDLKSRSTLSD